MDDVNMEKQQEVLLTPEELYFLGKQLGGDHMNYGYIMAMEDIGSVRNLSEEKIIGTLEEKGLMTENLMGDREVADFIKELLHPVFFGFYESSVDVVPAGMESARRTMWIHRDRQGFTVSVPAENGSFLFTRVTKEEIEDFALSLLPEDYNGKQPPTTMGELNLPEECTRVIVFKSARLPYRADEIPDEDEKVVDEAIGAPETYGETDMTAVYERGGYLCEKNADNDDYHILSPKMFYELATDFLVGDI